MNFLMWRRPTGHDRSKHVRTAPAGWIDDAAGGPPEPGGMDVLMAGCQMGTLAQTLIDRRADGGLPDGIAGADYDGAWNCC